LEIMKAKCFILLLGSLLLPPSIASACRFDMHAMVNPPAVFLPLSDDRLGIIPEPPTVAVKRIHRDTGGGCFRAFLTFTLPLSDSTRDHAYGITAVRGSPPGPDLSRPPLQAWEVDGELHITVTWSEMSAPSLDLQILVTAYSKYGRKGGSTLVSITHPTVTETSADGRVSWAPVTGLGSLPMHSGATTVFLSGIQNDARRETWTPPPSPPAGVYRWQGREFLDFRHSIVEYGGLESLVWRPSVEEQSVLEEETTRLLEALLECDRKKEEQRLTPCASTPASR
jgi:hypothetical protein